LLDELSDETDAYGGNPLRKETYRPPSEPLRLPAVWFLIKILVKSNDTRDGAVPACHNFSILDCGACDADSHRSHADVL
jgi:hypothetical protein